MSPTVEEQRLLDAVRTLRDQARLVADRLGIVWEKASVEGGRVADDALVAYRVAESKARPKQGVAGDGSRQSPAPLIPA